MRKFFGMCAFITLMRSNLFWSGLISAFNYLYAYRIVLAPSELLTSTGVMVLNLKHYFLWKRADTSQCVNPKHLNVWTIRQVRQTAENRLDILGWNLCGIIRYIIENIENRKKMKFIYHKYPTLIRGWIDQMPSGREQRPGVSGAHLVLVEQNL